MLGGNTGGGLFGTPQTGGLGRGTALGGGLGTGTGGGGLFGRQTGGLFGGTGGTNTLGGGGLFGQTPSSSQQTGGLFGGGGLGTGTTGGGLFQTPQSGLGAAQQKATGGLFGQSPMLGGSSTGNMLGGGGGGLFNNQASTSGGLFSKPQASTSGLTLGGGTGGLQLGGQAATTGGLFSSGGLGAQQGGTATKFEPVKGTDTLNKSGVTVNVNTRLHCITASPSYQQKSLEELRMEDYTLGRKGGGAGGGLFGGNLGGATGGGLFAQNKTLGGGLGGGLGTQTQLGTGLGGVSTGGGLFGGNQNKLGGTTGGLFGNTPQQNKLGLGLGGGGLFGQQQQTSQATGLGGGGLFGGGNTGGLFNQSAQGTQLGGLGTGTQLGGLGTQNQLGGGGLFNRGGTTGGLSFGGLQTGGGLGGTLGGGGLGTGLGNTAGGGLGGLGGGTLGTQAFNKPAGTGLGGGTLGLGQTQLGGNLNLGGGGLGGLGGTGGLNLGAGAGLSTLGGSKFGGANLMGTGTTGLGGGTGLGQSLTLGQSALQQQQQEAQLKQQLEILANSPFGDTALFRNAIYDASKQQKNKNSSTPVAPKPSPTSLQYKLNMRPSAKVKTISLSSPARHKEKSKMFEGLEDSPHSTSARSLSAGATPETFVPRKSIKKLTIKPKPTQPQTWPDSTTPPEASTPIFTSSSSAPPTAPSSVTELPPTDPSHTVDPVPTPSMAARDGKDRDTPTPVTSVPNSGGSAGVDTPDITLGTSALKKPGIRSLTGVMPPLGASPSLGGPVAGKGTAEKRVTMAEPPVEPLTRSPLRASGQEGESPLSSRGSPASGRSPSQTVRRCHVTLTGADYYTIPPLDECDELVEGTVCLVEGFTIGRTGFGEVHFPGQTDIYGLNLDKIVSIESREVVVYPDDLPGPKPSVGEELNKPAMIFIEGHWPRDKTTREFIKEKIRLEAMCYAAKLKKLVEKIGGKFVEYKPETGTCIFQVDHFSRYKVGDADDSDEEGDSQAGGVPKKLKTVQSKDKQLPNQPRPLRPKEQLERDALTQPAQTLSEPLTPAPQQEEEDIHMVSPTPLEDEGGVAMDTVSSSLRPTQEIVGGASTHHVQIMKASFFGGEDLNTTYSIPTPKLKPPSRTTRSTRHREEHTPIRPSTTHKPQGLSQGFPHNLHQTSLLTGTSAPAPPPPKPTFPSLPAGFPPLPQAIETPDPFTQFHSANRRPIPLTQRAPMANSLQAQSAMLMARRNLSRVLPIPSGKERCLCDHSLFLGRSFRVGWGPNWTLAHSGSLISPPATTPTSVGGWGQRFSMLARKEEEEEGHPIRVVLERVRVNSLEDSCDSYEPFLKSQLDTTDFAFSSPSVAPRCSPVVGTDLLNRFSDVCRSLPAGSSASDDQGTLRQLERVLRLMVVLWGDLPEHCGAGKELYDNQQLRKQRLYQWLKESNSAATEKEMSHFNVDEDEGYLKTLYSLVAGQQVAAACTLAQKHKDHKLALLLSQATYSSQNNKLFIHKQLDSWGRMDVHTHISPVRLKLYVLLAGLMTWEHPPVSINTSADLDWKRSLALHLCFGCGLSALIADVLSKYTDGFQSNDAYAPPPLPPHVEARGPEGSSSAGSFDTCYHLLQLYCNREYSLEQTLQPEASTPRQLDYRISWMVWSLLSSLEYTHMHPTIMSQLITSFSSQLVSCGKWHWAIFVLLHLQDPVLTQSAIQDVLDHSCCADEELSSLEVFVVEKLHVPKAWVWQAKAQRAGQEEWYDLKALHLLSAGKWNDAHSTIVEHLTVDAIINDDTEDVQQMLEQVAERSGQVQDWDTGGSIFLDYLRISTKFEQLRDSEDAPTDYEVESLHVGLKQLTARLGQLPSDTPRRVLCQSDMAQCTANFMRVVLELKSKKDFGSFKNEEMFVADGMTECLTSLPIPPDYAMTEYRTLFYTHMTNLSNLEDFALPEDTTTTEQ